MSTATNAIARRLAILAGLFVLACSLGLLLAACGANRSASPAQPRAGSSAWRVLPRAPITLEAGITSVWTGNEMIVTGIHAGADGSFVESTDVAAAYDPATRTWRRLPAPPRMQSYCRRSAVWTGEEMLVWGCGVVSFDPRTDHWQRLPQPPGGEGVAIWTGRELIGWGGGCCGDAGSDGAAYSPATGTWRKLAPSPLAPEQRPLGIWTGRELLLFVSGINPASGKPWPARLARAAAYDPAADSWRRLAPLPDQHLRLGGTAAWDGHEVLVVAAGEQARTAWAYDPAANRWRRLAPLPFGRVDATAVWTGTRLLVWGSAQSSPSSAGLAYDPGADRWSRLARAPLHGIGHTVVWTGRELLLWGGVVPTAMDTRTPARYLNKGAAFMPAPERSAR